MLFDHMDCSPPGSSVHEILQARTLEWVAIPFTRGIFPTQGWNPGLLLWQVDSLLSEPPGKPLLCLPVRSVLVAQSCATLCDPMDCSLPVSSVHGILQARILDWVDIPLGSHSLLQGIFLTRGSNTCLHTAGRLLTLWTIREAHIVSVHVCQVSVRAYGP